MASEFALLARTTGKQDLFFVVFGAADHGETQTPPGPCHLFWEDIIAQLYIAKTLNLCRERRCVADQLRRLATRVSARRPERESSPE